MYLGRQHDTLYVVIITICVDMSTDKPHNKLGTRIRKMLDEAGISQRELARKLNVGPNQVSRWVIGAVAPTYTVLSDILKLCRQPHQGTWLLTGREKSSTEVHAGNTADNTVISKHEQELDMLKDDLINQMRKTEDISDQLRVVLHENAELRERILVSEQLTPTKHKGGQAI